MVFTHIPRCISWTLAICLALTVACQEGPSPEGELTTPTPASEQEEFVARRNALVDKFVKRRDISDPLVADALRAVPREEFVLLDDRFRAYWDQALPIKEGQTISQPYVVALMTEYLALEPGERVLEIGTGSGYQAAVLAEITDEVYTVEIITLLAQEATERLKRLGYDQVQTLNADGYYGWEEHAPYDAIIVTAAPDHVPQTLLEQLKDDGNMVVPVGPPGLVQTLWLIQKRGQEIKRINKGEVRFVPFLRE